MKIKLASAETVAKLLSPKKPTQTKLPGEKRAFTELCSERNLTPPQTLIGHNTIVSSRRAEVRREPSIDEKFQAFLQGEIRQRNAIRRQLLAEHYRSQFLTNILSA
jgi:hypothetical protein